MSIDLFQPYKIGSLELKNRFVRSATNDGTADGTGSTTDKSVALYRELAQGGVGLIMSGHTFVSPLGQASYIQYGVHSDDMIAGLRRMVQAAHEGGARIALQIAHAGIRSNYLQRSGITALAVSAMPDIKAAHREMAEEDIEAVIADFAAAAVRAVEAGFDAIQIHGAHGYLMSQFLSPLYNHRSDRWGGSPQNRRRFHLEVLGGVRRAVGDDFPVFIKLGPQDDREGGLKLEEGIDTARELAEAGIDAIEVSAGFGDPIRVFKEGEPARAYLRETAAMVKRAVKVPVMMVGGIRSLATAKDIIESGDADLISMCRPFIREPGFLKRWQSGETMHTSCISCNKCLGLGASGGSMECGEERRLREKDPA